MSEPESLDTDEALPRRIERHGFDRLIMLSDGVFAIAMTLLALEVRPPHEWSGGFGDLLASMWRALFGYGLSFLIIALFWFSNRAIMARVRRVDGPFSAMMLAFLCLICLTPFATGLVAEHGPARAMKVYSLLVGTTGAIQALLWCYAAFWRGLLDPGVDRAERWITLAAFLMLPFTFSLTGALIGSTAGAVVMAPLVLVAVVLGRAKRRLTRRQR